MPLSPEAASLDDIFDDLQTEPKRDQYGRPLLVPSGKHVMELQPRKARADGKVPYTRASALGGYVTDHSALETWKQRSLTKGLSEREDLAAMAAALPPIIGNARDKKSMTREEQISDKLTNARLDEVAEEAMIYANRDYKANWGTAVHSFTDPGPSGDVPARMAADVQSWFDKTRGWEFHATELFVANDRYQSAGTFDHLVTIPGQEWRGRLVVDKKTGLLHPEQFCVQLHVYADGDPYDVATDKRTDWPDGERPSQEWGVLAHIPLGLGRTDLYLVDLIEGRVAAELAVGVRRHRMNKTLMQPFDPAVDLHLHIAGLFAAADCKATLFAIRQQYDALLTPELIAVGRQRLAEFQAAA